MSGFTREYSSDVSLTSIRCPFSNGGRRMRPVIGRPAVEKNILKFERRGTKLQLGLQRGNAGEFSLQAAIEHTQESSMVVSHFPILL
jgi:hypothetical protein